MNNIILFHGIIMFLYAAGFVLIEDIEEIVSEDPRNPSNVLVLVLVESTRALKNSKGRVTIAIQFDSQGECQKFASSLSIMKQFFDIDS